jgi:acetylornithine/succinyldiaminopimelate/putrescine aminotransferase
VPGRPIPFVRKAIDTAASAASQTATSEVKARQPIVAEVRGAGLMWGLELTCDATAAAEGALQRGVLVNRTATTVVRLLPPLTISESELDAGLQVLESVLAELPAAAGALA